MADFLSIDKHDGQPLIVGDMTVIPESWALTLRWPGGGYVWNRPLAVRVERGGQVERMPVIDVTRVALIALAMWAILFAVVTNLSKRSKK